MTDNYEMTTVNRHDFFEVSSTLQKAIRRGNEDLALSATVEMFNSNFGEYVWKRLKIMVSEDIGLANNALATQIASLYSFYKEQKSKKDAKHQPERLYLIHAVLLLVRSPKSRYIDWTLCYYFNRFDKLTVPDFALDMHTKRGRRMGRGKEHFWNEASKLENHQKLEGEDEMKAKAFEVFGSGTLFD